MKKHYAVQEHTRFVDVALLLVRLVTGIAFMFHGWGKIQNPLGWMGPDAFAPPVFQALAAIAEFGGGLAWVIGLLTPIASIGILCTMAVAIYMHVVMRGDPFVSPTGGPSIELAAVYFSIALLLLTIGPGRYSLDRQYFGARH